MHQESTNIKNVLTHSRKILKQLVNSESDPENVMAILRSLEGLKCEMSCDVTKATQLSDRANSLFKSMRAMINWMIAKEDKRRTNEPSVKKAEVEMPEDELFGVSDIEINEDSDQDQYPKDQVPHSNDEIDSQSEILTKKKRVHKDYGRHQCGVCHKVFPWRQSLNLHKREHFDDVEKRLPYQCEICSKRFGHPTAFKNHKIIHLPADHPIKKALTCEICAKVFNFKQRFDRHMKTHLADEESRKPFKCDECDLRFSEMYLLAKHKKREHLSKSALAKHKLAHLDKGDPARLAKMLKCDICEKSVFTPFDLARHMETHLDDNDPSKRKFKCEQCEMLFRNPQNLKNHMHTHSGDYPFKCDLCPKGYASKTHLQMHKKHHELGTLKPKWKRRNKEMRRMENEVSGDSNSMNLSGDSSESEESDGDGKEFEDKEQLLRILEA